MIRSGLIGRAILASRSPWLHEQEARAQGVDLSYELFDFDDRGWGDEHLGPLLRSLATDGFNGFNVTYPFKQAVIPLLDQLDGSAELVGAVNTVAIRESGLTGYNTDMPGFRESFLRGLPGVATDEVLQIGAGGAGSAVAVAMLSIGTRRLTIADLDASRAQTLAARLGEAFPAADIAGVSSAQISPAGYSGVVNTTPMGMAASPGSPVESALLSPEQWVADIVYFPLETELLREAHARGCRVLDGSGMVIAQAALAFEIINGLPADAARMRESFFVT
jgi:shikimate dehydrogenase